MDKKRKAHGCDVMRHYIARALAQLTKEGYTQAEQDKILAMVTNPLSEFYEDCRKKLGIRITHF